jgi:hypothetical protein
LEIDRTKHKGIRFSKAKAITLCVTFASYSTTYSTGKLTGQGIRPVDKMSITHQKILQLLFNDAVSYIDSVGKGIEDFETTESFALGHILLHNGSSSNICLTFKLSIQNDYFSSTRSPKSGTTIFNNTKPWQYLPSENRVYVYSVHQNRFDIMSSKYSEITLTNHFEDIPAADGKPMLLIFDESIMEFQAKNYFFVTSQAKQCLQDQ